ncbi:hypothetical protein [Streptomyces sp. NPDC047868]|uniref:hypothetical protein n=1 Tax=Streptomyces sp. NPDC047868 TaxID=3155480 RepID=UPI003454B91C
MTTMTFAPAATEPGDNAYNAGYTDGELDAATKLPAAMATTRASLADQYDPLWAQGYADGYLDEIQRNHAYSQKEQAA